MKKEHIVIGIIFLVVFGTRLFFAFQTPHFSSDEAYYNIRQVTNIKQTFLPIIIDDLSYGGKILYLPPLYYYVLAGLNFVFPIVFVGKFFPNLFASSIVIISYLIAARLTKNKAARFFTATMVGFMPILFSETLNSMSSNSFVLPLVFFTLYCMMRIANHEKQFIGYFITTLLILRITTPSVIFLIFALLLYLLFIFVEGLKKSRAEIELILFSTFLIIWTLFVSFKNVFLNHGLAILWQNIPQELLKNFFAGTNLLTAIYLIGIIPFVFGLYTIYRFAFREKENKTYLLISFAIVIGLLMWLRLIALNLALMLIGVVTALLFAKSYTLLLAKIKNRKLKFLFNIIFFLLIVSSSIIPSIALASNKMKSAYSNEEIEALEWIKDNTDEGAVILSTLGEGHLIATVAERKNFVDTNFLFVGDIDQRLKDTSLIYKTTSQTQAINLLNQYGIDYIYFSKRAKKDYYIDSLYYLDENCFEEVFINKDVKIYKSLCFLEQI